LIVEEGVLTMMQFLEEQETTSKPPEPRGEKTPDEEPEADEDSCKWDGSEAELVADETAESFEEQHTGIKLKFSLTAGEIFSALMKTQYTDARIASSVIGTILSAGLAVYFLVQLNHTGNMDFSFLAVICGVLIILIGAVPLIRIKMQAARAADGHEVKMKIYPDFIEMGHTGQKWEIPLNGNTERAVFKNLIVLYIDGKNMVILPLRCVEPAVLPEVQAMIFAGTQPAD
jgi:hypothetical protein